MIAIPPAATRSRRLRASLSHKWTALLLAFLLLALVVASALWAQSRLPGRSPAQWLLHPIYSLTYALGGNPHPVALVLPPNRALSAVAELGKQLFFDTALSASGKQSCASCHDPASGYNPPPGSGPVMLGGPQLTSPGFRPPPSLAYLYRQQNFAIGPDSETNEKCS